MMKRSTVVTFQRVLLVSMLAVCLVTVSLAFEPDWVQAITGESDTTIPLAIESHPDGGALVFGQGYFTDSSTDEFAVVRLGVDGDVLSTYTYPGRVLASAERSPDGGFGFLGLMADGASVMKLNADGSHAWTWVFSGGDAGPVQIEISKSGKLYSLFGRYDPHLVCLTSSGELVYDIDIPDGLPSRLFKVDSDDNVYFCDHPDGIVRFAKFDSRFELLWDLTLPESDGVFARRLRLRSGGGGPVLLNDGHDGARVIAFRPNGEVEWRRDLSLDVSFAPENLWIGPAGEVSITGVVTHSVNSLSVSSALITADGSSLWQGEGSDLFFDIDRPHVGVTHHGGLYSAAVGHSEEHPGGALNIAAWTASGDLLDEGSVATEYYQEYTELSAVISYGICVDPFDNIYALYEVMDPQHGPSHMEVVGWHGFARLLEAEEGISPVAQPGSVALSPAWPNPFNASTSLRITLVNPQRVTLQVHDVLGRRVMQLVQGQQMAEGEHTISLRGENLPSGTYLITLQGETMSTSRRVTLVK